MIVLKNSYIAVFNIIMTSRLVFMILVNLTYRLSCVRTHVYKMIPTPYSQFSNFGKICLYSQELDFYVTWLLCLLLIL
jgi:hypothetical protein